MRNNPIKIISIIVIILSLAIIGGIIYQQRGTIITSTLQASKKVADAFPLINLNKIPKWNSTGSTTDQSLIKEGEEVDQTVKFEKIADKAVASAGIVDLPGASSTLLYMEKETGHIFQIKTGQPAERISNLTITDVFDAQFGIDKSKNIRAVVRTVKGDRLQTTILNLNNNSAFATSSDSSLQITKNPLSSNVRSVVISPKKDKLLLIEDLGSQIAVYTSDFDLKSKKIVKVVPFRDWLINWPSDNIITFQTKSSSDVPGSIYYLNLKDGSFHRVGNNILGLTAIISPDAKNIVYSNSTGQSFNLTVRNIITNQAINYSPKTLPEKCVWLNTNTVLVCAVPSNLPLASYPDDWYQGNISFNDSLWIYYSENAQSVLVYTPEITLGSDTGLDLLPQGTDDLYNVYFIDKKTSQLYRLNGGAVFSPDA